MKLLEILDSPRAAQVEQVLAHADVLGTVTFASSDVSQRMLDKIDRGIVEPTSSDELFRRGRQRLAR